MTQDPSDQQEPAPEEEDPIVAECLRDALGPYEGALSPEELADYRAFLTLFITTHLAAAPLYERLRKKPLVVSESGVMPRERAAAHVETPVLGTGTSGRSR
jgi:hypothetical protein